MELGIKGKVALITGGDSGMGRATAKLLADEGVKIALLDKTTDQLQDTLEEVKMVGVAFAVQADLRSLAEVETAKNKIIERFGTVDILVHCAGITGATGEFLEISDQDWREALEVDLMAAVRVCRAFIPLMRQSGWGRVVLVAHRKARPVSVNLREQLLKLNFGDDAGELLNMLNIRAYSGCFI